MIYFVTTAEHMYTVDALQGGYDGVPDCRAVSYDTLFSAPELRGGTYVFTDMERVSASELTLAAGFHAALRDRPGFRVLNDPARVKTRYALLRGLREAGLNDFDAYRADGGPRPERFPVFVRAEAAHDAALTGLIETQDELDRALDGLVAQGRPLRGLIVIEYKAEAIRPGVYRRWGGFMIGGAAHLDHAVQEDHWNVKWGTSGLTDEATFVELDAAIRANAHEAAVRAAFAVAGIDYGRADFGIVGGRTQVWEINTNPFHYLRPPHRSATWTGAMRFSEQRLARTLWSIDTAGDAAVSLASGDLPEAARPLLDEHRARAAAAASSAPSRADAERRDDALAAEIAALRDENRSLRASRDALTASRSWRVTAPFRSALGRVQRTRAALRPAVVPGSAAICMLRDCRDIVPFLCGHYLRLGFERIQFIDDDSTDGSREMLADLSRRESRIRVRPSGVPRRHQTEELGAAANEAIAEGFRLIVPFDADEFWNLDSARLAGLLADPSPRVIYGRWVAFAQGRGAVGPRPGSLFGLRRRLPAEASAATVDVVAYREPFIAIPDSKVAVVSDAPIVFERGQHMLTEGPARVEPRTFEVFHLPLRNRGELLKRALNYEPRRAPLRLDGDESWQSAFHAEAVRAGRTDAVWAANSVDRHGCLDVYGVDRPTVPDRRLVDVLVRSSLYMTLRHRRLAV